MAGGHSGMGDGTNGAPRPSQSPAVGICPLAHRQEPDRPRRVAEGLAVCRGHERRVGDALTELPRFYDELLLRHLGGPTVGAPKVSGSSEDKMPYRPDVGDERELIAGQLRSWLNWLRAERRIGDGMALRGVGLGNCVLSLSYHLGFILASEMAEDFCDEILERHQKAYSILYPTGRRKFAVGQCTATDCAGVVYAILRDTDELLPSALKCGTCELNIPASEWLRYGRAIQAQLQKAGTP